MPTSNRTLEPPANGREKQVELCGTGLCLNPSGEHSHASSLLWTYDLHNCEAVNCGTAALEDKLDRNEIASELGAAELWAQEAKKALMQPLVLAPPPRPFIRAPLTSSGEEPVGSCIHREHE
jgi:hypothetical protein